MRKEIMIRIFTKFVAALLPAAAAIALSSCVLDTYRGNPEEKGESVTFKISVPAPTPSGTRALLQADEYAVQDVSVLAFDKTAKTFIGRYSGRIVSGPTHTGGSSATVTFEVSLPIGEFDIMLIANGKKILAANGAALVAGASQASVEEALTMNMDTAGWNTDTSSADYYGIPMWGYVKGVAVPSESAIGTVCLTRMVAKVDIRISDSVIADNNFKIYYIRLYNYVEQGRLIPDTGGAFDWTAVTQANLGDNLAPTLPTGYTKADPYANPSKYLSYTAKYPHEFLYNSIYLFEAPAGVAPAADGAHVRNTCFIVGGFYSADGGVSYAWETWYRIDFAKQTDDTLTAYDYLPILRNNSYTVTITGVTGLGHATPEEALENAPSNMTATIIDWANPDITHLVTNGIYILGVSQDKFEFSFDEHDAACTDNRLTIVTDYSDGWTATVWADEAGTVPVPNDGTSGQPWLRLPVSSGNGNHPTGNEIQLILDKNSPNVRSAYIHITAGALNYIVKVVQNKGLPALPDKDIPVINVPMTTYVGAFWRTDQRAERLITMPITAGYDYAVQVLDKGDFTENDIVFIEGHDTVIDSADPDYGDTKRYVIDGKTALSGTVPAGGLKFRIGLKTTCAAGTVRYARVLVSFGNDYQYKRVIWLRQGHEADYLMRPTDGSTGDWVSSSRPLAAKYSPYNLTNPAFKGTASTVESVKVQNEELGGIASPAVNYFTDYPSQAGAFFQFSPNYGVYAFNPVAPNNASLPTDWALTFTQAYWDDIKSTTETCPAGYRRPTNGPTDSDNQTITPSDSEMAQSLWWKPQDTNSNIENAVWGYYADGFFDRLSITDQAAFRGGATTGSAVVTDTSDVAYIGQLFYNPNSGSNASIFFPAAGWRNGNSGSENSYLHNTGATGCYWSSSANTAAYGYVLQVTSSIASRNNSRRSFGFSVRCVVE